MNAGAVVLVATAYRCAALRLVAGPGWQLDGAMGMGLLPIDGAAATTSSSALLPLGGVMYGQSRDVIVRVKATAGRGAARGGGGGGAGGGPMLTASFITPALSDDGTAPSVAVPSAMAASPHDYDYLRLSAVEAVTATSPPHNVTSPRSRRWRMRWRRGMRLRGQTAASLRWPARW